MTGSSMPMIGAVEPVAAAELAAAAFGDDPMFTNILPTAKSRTRLLARMLAASFRMDLKHGGSLVGAKVDGRLAGIALWHPRADADPPWWTWLRQAGLLVNVVSRPRAGGRAVRVTQAVEKLRPLQGTHSYLRVHAVAPVLQGRGLGSALMEDILGRSRLLHRKIYLETFRERNIRYYGRFGFKVLSTVRLPERPAFWALST